LRSDEAEFVSPKTAFRNPQSEIRNVEIRNVNASAIQCKRLGARG
jgi:hypothetical protein